jgi:hypothetical protein
MGLLGVEKAVVIGGLAASFVELVNKSQGGLAVFG